MKLIKTTARRLLVVLLILVMVVPAYAINAFAEITSIWDGKTSTGGNAGNSTNGSYSLHNADKQDIVGYRFSVFDTSGNKKGHSVDVYLSESSTAKNHINGAYYSGQQYDKISLYRLIQSNGIDFVDLETTPLVAPAPTSTNEVLGKNMSTCAYWDNYVMSEHGTDSLLSYDPSCLEAWCNTVNCPVVAEELCGTTIYNEFYDYIIVEPLILAYCSTAHFISTVSEWAVFQSLSWGGKASDHYNSISSYTDSENSYGNIIYHMSGLFPLYLYAEGNYFGVSGVESSERVTKKLGLFFNGTGASVGDNTIRNTSKALIENMVGVGVYTAKDSGGGHIETDVGEASVLIRLDESAYLNYRETDVKLKKGNDFYSIMAVDAGSLYSLKRSDLLYGDYEIYVGGVATGSIVTVNKAEGSIGYVDYYSVPVEVYKDGALFTGFSGTIRTAFDIALGVNEGTVPITNGIGETVYLKQDSTLYVYAPKYPSTSLVEDYVIVGSKSLNGIAEAIEVNYYTLTLAKDSGVSVVAIPKPSLGPHLNTFSEAFLSGTTVEFNATLNSGYEFSEWVGTGNALT